MKNIIIILLIQIAIYAGQINSVQDFTIYPIIFIF